MICYNISKESYLLYIEQPLNIRTALGLFNIE